MVALATYAGLSVRGGYEGAPEQEAQKAYWKRNSKHSSDSSRLQTVSKKIL